MQIPQNITTTDDINNTIAYDEVSDTLKDFAQKYSCNLIEHFAQKIASVLLSRYSQILWLRVEVKNLALLLMH